MELPVDDGDLEDRTDDDVGKAAAGIAEAAFFNGGQDCTAATRALVHESVYAQFIEALVAKAQTLRPGAPKDPDAFYGPLNNVRHFRVVREKIATLPEYATILTGGQREGNKGFYFAPTVIADVGQSGYGVEDYTRIKHVMSAHDSLSDRKPFHHTKI